MRRIRSTPVLLRLVVALLFGFMSLGHWPVMAFAGGAAPAHHHSQMTGHHDAAAHAAHATATVDASQPEPQPACHAVGCFVVMAPAPIAAPAAASTLLDRLAPGAADRIDPAAPKPADPPPRLQS